MAAEKRSISAPEGLFAQADRRCAELGYSTFSDYIQALIRADTVQGGAHLRETAATPQPPAAPVHYGVPSAPAAPAPAPRRRPSSASREDSRRKIVDVVKRHHPAKGSPAPQPTESK